jgi:hypothetical protein
MLRHGWLSPYGISRFVSPLADPFPVSSTFRFPIPAASCRPGAKRKDRAAHRRPRSPRPARLAATSWAAASFQQENDDDSVSLIVALGERVGRS